MRRMRFPCMRSISGQQHVERVHDRRMLSRKRLNRLTELTERNRGSELGYHDDIFMPDFEQGVKLCRPLRACRGQEWNHEARVEAAEHVGLAIEQISWPGAPGVNIEPCHQNCRYSASGSPCSSTQAFQYSIAPRFSSSQASRSAFLPCSSSPCSQAWEILISSRRASSIRSEGRETLVGLRGADFRAATFMRIIYAHSLCGSTPM